MKNSKKDTKKDGKKIPKLKSLPSEKDFQPINLKFVPKNNKQKKAYDVIGKYPISFLLGDWGSGKTFIAIVKALKMLEEGLINKIVLLRPIAVEKEEYMGYLSGDMDQKNLPFMLPYFQQIEDLIGANRLEKMIEDKVLIPYSMAYVRGLNYKSTFVIIDEIQNASSKSLKRVLSRIDDNSKVVCLGDKDQKDVEDDFPSSIDDLDRFRNNPNFGFVQFEKADNVRGTISKIVCECYEDKPNMESDITVYSSDKY